jgi:hypothetical protein
MGARASAGVRLDAVALLVLLRGPALGPVSPPSAFAARTVPVDVADTRGLPDGRDVERLREDGMNRVHWSVLVPSFVRLTVDLSAVVAYFVTGDGAPSSIELEALLLAGIAPTGGALGRASR